MLALLEPRPLNAGWMEVADMAVMVAGDELQDAVREETFIKGGEVSCAEGVKYDFRLSPRILKAKWGQPVNMGEKSEEDLFIEPGEVVFVLTEERLELPSDIMAFLSPKRKLSHDGILSMGGLCVDPGYKGRILVGLFNISSTRWPLIRGKKLIAATFHRLEGQELGNLPAPPLPLDDFPPELVRVIKEYQPVALQTLASGLNALESQVLDLRRQVSTSETWVSRFQEYLDAHNAQIGNVAEQLKQLASELRTEVDARKGGEAELKSSLVWLKGAAWMLAGVLSVSVAIFVAWVTGLLPIPGKP